MIFTHFILTRYALQMDGRPLPSEKWLEHRRRMFERFCLPSIQAQSNGDFVWLVFCDPRVRSAMDLLDASRRECSQLVVVPTNEPWDNFDATLRAAVMAHLKPRTTHIITTRLDNDDAIGHAFVDLVQAQCEGLPERRFVNFEVGRNFNVQSGRANDHPHPCNMFVSCIEPADQFRGVLAWAHNSVEGVAHVIRIAEPGQWTHTVHPYNEWPQGRVE